MRGTYSIKFFYISRHKRWKECQMSIFSKQILLQWKSVLHNLFNSTSHGNSEQETNCSIHLIMLVPQTTYGEKYWNKPPQTNRRVIKSYKGYFNKSSNSYGKKVWGGIGKLNAPVNTSSTVALLNHQLNCYSNIQWNKDFTKSQIQKQIPLWYKGFFPTKKKKNIPPFTVGFLRCKSKVRVNWLRFKAAGWLFTPTFIQTHWL